ncbi:hypothetical protein HNQ59_000587 [Chitinivorax tropicus]|uniref:Uncharacterized protein n=1 Tax=Chitinivorax tropicus TaxID=714531 RepID=A0A840MMA0_9PROT|nr:hypothetical protein [Chitinivorax tropicus]
MPRTVSSLTARPNTTMPHLIRQAVRQIAQHDASQGGLHRTMPPYKARGMVIYASQGAGQCGPCNAANRTEPYFRLRCRSMISWLRLADTFLSFSS